MGAPVQKCGTSRTVDSHKVLVELAHFDNSSGSLPPSRLGPRLVLDAGEEFVGRKLPQLKLSGITAGGNLMTGPALPEGARPGARASKSIFVLLPHTEILKLRASGGDLASGEV